MYICIANTAIWPAEANLGWRWPSMAPNGRPRPTIAGHGQTENPFVLTLNDVQKRQWVFINITPYGARFSNHCKHRCKKDVRYCSKNRFVEAQEGIEKRSLFSTALKRLLGTTLELLAGTILELFGALKWFQNRSRNVFKREQAQKLKMWQNYYFY